MTDNFGTECKLCGQHCALVYLDKEYGSVCSKCMRELNPPRMSIIKFGDSSELYNNLAKKYEFIMTLKSLKECGWRMYEVIEDIGKHPRTEYFMEYRGVARCARFPNYHYWENGTTECLRNNCKSMISIEDRRILKF